MLYNFLFYIYIIDMLKKNELKIEFVDTYFLSTY